MAWMTKDAQVRVNEVIAFIAGQAPAPERVAMTTYLTNWLNSASGNSAAALKDISEGLTMTNVSHAGNKDERAKCRALILLEAMKINSSVPAAKAAVSGLAGGLLDNRIADAIAKLRIEVNEINGNGALIQNEFLTGLKGQTQLFLQNKRVLSGAIAGGAQCYIFYEYKKDQFTLDPTRPPAMVQAYQFNAVSIPAVPWLNVPGRTNAPNAGSFAQIAGTHLTGADVMISTMFSGCAFCFKVAGGQLYAAHIMPDDQNGNAINGATMAQQLAGQVGTVTGGDFPGTAAGNFYVYGAGYSNLPGPLAGGYPVRTALDEFMNIIGVETGGNWEIYSQSIKNNIKTVVRLYP